MAFLLAASIALSESPPAWPFPPAEKWVLEKVAVGEVADLKTQFPDEADRVLRASFLEQLLTSKHVEVHRNGVRIWHAVLTEPIDLQRAEITHELWLVGCRFEQPVDFGYSVFRKNLIFNESSFKTARFNSIKVDRNTSFRGTVFMESVDFAHAEITGNFDAYRANFESTAATANFNGIKVGRLAIFHGAVFAGSANFNHADIAGAFMGQGIQFTHAQAHVIFHMMNVGDSLSYERAVFAGPVNFSGLKVAVAAFFRGAIFAGPVDFSHVNIGVNLGADDVQFLHATDPVNFESIKINGSAFMRKALFKGAANFARANIAADFNADEAQFTSTDQIARFSGMSVGGHTYFRKAVFAGPVDFLYVDIAGNFAADETKFTNTGKIVSFTAIKVGQQASFSKAKFAGQVNFRLADISSFFVISEAQFDSASFYEMRVGRGAVLWKAAFAGAVSFGQATIGGEFRAHEAEFKNTEIAADFAGMNVAGPTSFERTLFAGPISLQQARFRDLLIQGPQGDPRLVSQLDLSRAVITGELRLEDVNLSTLLAGSVRVDGSAVLNRVSVNREVNLEHSTFLTLVLSEVTWPTVSASIRLNGMTYQHMRDTSPGVGKDPWERLLDLLDRAAYSPDAYLNLEAFFRRQGYPEPADEVFVAQKRRERKEMLHGSQRLFDRLQDWWTCYGRCRERLLCFSGIIGAGFLSGGLFLFRHRSMEPRKPEDAAGNYHAFWYTLDLLLPIDLEAKNVWQPKQDCRWAWLYLRVLKMLGGILIAFSVIGLAALAF